MTRWGNETFDHLVSLVHSEDAVQAGVQLCYAHCLFLAPEPDPFWASSVHGFRRMSKQELQLFSKPVDWPDIQAAAAASAALGACNSTSSAAGDGSIDSYTAAATATAFVDGYTFNTVSLPSSLGRGGWCLPDSFMSVLAYLQAHV